MSFSYYCLLLDIWVRFVGNNQVSCFYGVSSSSFIPFFPFLFLYSLFFFLSFLSFFLSFSVAFFLSFFVTLCLFLPFFSSFLFRKKIFTSLHYFVHLNLSIALFLAYLVFAVGVEWAAKNEVKNRFFCCNHFQFNPDHFKDCL